MYMYMLHYLSYSTQIEVKEDSYCATYLFLLCIAEQFAVGHTKSAVAIKP